MASVVWRKDRQAWWAYYIDGAGRHLRSFHRIHGNDAPKDTKLRFAVAHTNARPFVIPVRELWVGHFVFVGLSHPVAATRLRLWPA